MKGGDRLKSFTSLFQFSCVRTLESDLSLLCLHLLHICFDLSETKRISFVVSLRPLNCLKENSLKGNGLLLFQTGPNQDPFLSSF